MQDGLIPGFPADSLAIRKSLGRDISGGTESQDVPVVEKDINKEETPVKPKLAVAEDTKPIIIINDDIAAGSQFFTTKINKAHEALSNATKQQIACSDAPQESETMNSIPSISGSFQLM